MPLDCVSSREASPPRCNAVRAAACLPTFGKLAPFLPVEQLNVCCSKFTQSISETEDALVNNVGISCSSYMQSGCQCQSW